MERLSSHPLPPRALRRPELRHIYETTPPAPRVASPTPPPAQVSTPPAPYVGSPTPPSARVSTSPDPSRRPEQALAGRYVLERQIDEGGTATIHRALDLATGEQRAVKLLSEASAADPTLRRCFLQGARSAMAIAHQNVVRVLAVHETGAERPFAVMELLRGDPLHVLLAREQRLSPDLVISLARGAARGLHAAHASGLVHCDVKPENLFAVEENRVRTLKILDFDLAFVPGSESQADAEGPVFLRGTAKYMAPEQIVGDPVDPRTDVYALGVVMFRLLTGHVPFDLELGTTLLRHQLGSPVPPPSWLNDRLDRRLDSVVVRATRKDPDNRYADMAELLSDLDALSLDLEPLARPLPPSSDRYVPRTERARDAVRALGAAA
jgi:eukaryotic-like serine/threonine-protein kinase